MASGPAPKDPAIRQMRKNISTKALLPADKAPIVETPQLPELAGDREWHPLTIAWWEDLWVSPMSVEYMKMDLHGLVNLALLLDQFYNRPTAVLHAEIRLAQQNYGLTPLDRRRLEWTVTKTEEAKDNYEHRRASRAQIIGHDDDPRKVLDV